MPIALVHVGTVTERLGAELAQGVGVALPKRHGRAVWEHGECHKDATSVVSQ
jgi:hypothetical protein